MVFSSLVFLYRFLPVSLLIYYSVPKRFRNAALFFLSLIFYAWGEPVYVSLMIFSTLVDYLLGKKVGECRDTGSGNGKKYVVISAVVNLSLLGIFKYADFIVLTFNNLLGTHIPLLNLALPVGISFYTFQTMSYTIDVYRGEAPPQKSIIALGAYVSSFPQLIAGPIVRYNEVAEDLLYRRETAELFSEGITRFVSGLGKKVLLANSIGMLFTAVTGGEVTMLGAWMGVIAYGLQIYFDFSGYSDMAIGLGKMFGFSFPENFNYPYMSKSITEFWRRWHISLGSWFKDYVYIPLGGNRRGAAAAVRNILIVWLLTGLWHGAGCNFILWGVYFAFFFLLLERAGLKMILERLPAFLRHVYTIVVVSFSWAIFFFEDMAVLRSYIKAMAGLGVDLFSGGDIYLLKSYGLTLLILFVGATPLFSLWAGERFERFTPVFVVGILLLSTTYLVDASYNPFLYFRF